MTDELLQQPIVWVDSDAALEKCCEAWEDIELLVLDTEFMRSVTYFPKAGLIQVSDGRKNYLIDPLKIQDWYPLIDILDNERHIIALHSCSEDLEVLQVEIGCVPARIFDTQIAAAFLGMQSSLGYAALAKQILDVDIPKSETRSDWLQRPLSKPQVYYAALDVEYLFILATKLWQELESLGRTSWVLEEGRRVYRNYKDLQDLNNSHARIKSAWKLNQRKLAVLMALARWRENFAQENDVPRNRVVKEKPLFEIALHCPRSISNLREIGDIPERIIRQQGQEILNTVTAALELDESELPKSLPRPLGKVERDMLQTLRNEMKSCAENLNVAPELMLRKKESEALIRFKLEDNWEEIQTYFTGWRKEAVSKHLVESLKSL